MKSPTVLSSVESRRSGARFCVLGHFRSLFESVRLQRSRDTVPKPTVFGVDAALGEEPGEPSLHDIHAAELEASCVPLEMTRETAFRELRHDDPGELRRARRVFAAAWLVPFLLVCAALELFGSSMDRPVASLLQSSLLVLAVPLGGSLLCMLSRRLMRR